MVQEQVRGHREVKDALHEKMRDFFVELASAEAGCRRTRAWSLFS